MARKSIDNLLATVQLLPLPDDLEPKPKTVSPPSLLPLLIPENYPPSTRTKRRQEGLDSPPRSPDLGEVEISGDVQKRVEEADAVEVLAALAGPNQSRSNPVGPEIPTLKVAGIRLTRSPNLFFACSRAVATRQQPELSWRSTLGPTQV